ncbi:hypothetical protein VF21_09122 [Pseudogymnoascus sp. 05NY08]|nr:hypothetical protein VF21_09122 [Pseudogymnoascus sp. 05NY08]
MYAVSLMDRTNLGNAAIAGMNEELGMEGGYRYSTNCTGLLCDICFGFPKTWVPLIPLRLLLGVFEAGFFPGCVYLISAWYARFDIQKRYAVFYLSGTVLSGFSGILAYGIQQMDGLGEYSGWRWIFILEGILSVIVAVIGWIYLVDFPDRLISNQPGVFSRWTRWNSSFAESTKTEETPRPNRGILRNGPPRGWIGSCLTTMAYALSYFLPIILKNNLHMSVAEAQCLTAPPSILAAICMGFFAWAGDKYHVRGPLLLLNCLLGFIGLPLLGFAKQPAVRYFGTFLMCVSGQGAIPTDLAYQANNITGHWKRAFCSASLIGAGGIGGIAGSLVFRSQDAPNYRPGIYAGLACNAVVVVVVCVNTVVFRRENRRADREGKILEGTPGFRYTI